MTRPRKPSKLHEISGYYKAHPERKRTGEPTPREGIGKPPKTFSTDFGTVWDELVDCVCPGVLGNSDRIHLEMTANLLCEFRADPTAMTGAKISLLTQCLGRLGMNPVDRTRLTIQPQTEKLPEDEYF